jgi:four helix bundle protein
MCIRDRWGCEMWGCEMWECEMWGYEMWGYEMWGWKMWIQCLHSTIHQNILIFITSNISPMDKQELKNRTKRFAIKVLHFVEKLPNTYLGKHLKGQLIRCSTSVAANYRAACLAQSRAAYIAKLSIVIEEADESEFWIELIEEHQLLDESICTTLKSEAHELASIFIVTRNSLRKK